MRILEAVADGVPGGGTAHVLQLIAAVRAHLPVEVHLVSQAGSPALAEARRLGAIVHGLDFFSSRFDPRLWLRLGALVRRLRPTLIHAHGARAGLPLAAIAGRRLIYSVHGYHFVGKAWPARQLAILAERRCSRRAGPHAVRLRIRPRARRRGRDPPPLPPRAHDPQRHRARPAAGDRQPRRALPGLPRPAGRAEEPAPAAGACSTRCAARAFGWRSSAMARWRRRCGSAPPPWR